MKESSSRMQESRGRIKEAGIGPVEQAGGAIVTWYDYRNPSTHYDIYVQRVRDLPARLSMPLLLKRHQ